MFQKMSDEELEIRTRDAQIRRQQIVNNKQNKESPEDSLHPTTDKEFKQRYGGALYQEENYNPSSTQPTNVQVEKGKNHGGKKRRTKVLLVERMQKALPISKRAHALNALNRLVHNKEYVSESKLGQAGYLAGKMYGKTVGRGLMTTAYLWTNFIWFFVQIWLGILLVVALAIAIFLEGLIASNVGEVVINKYLESQEVDWDFHFVLYLCFVAVVVVGYIQLFGVAIQAKMLLLKPLGGSGSLFKTAMFLICLVGYWIPVVNCFPLVNLYIFSIQASPR